MYKKPLFVMILVLVSMNIAVSGCGKKDTNPEELGILLEGHVTEPGGLKWKPLRTDTDIR